MHQRRQRFIGPACLDQPVIRRIEDGFQDQQVFGIVINQQNRRWGVVILKAMDYRCNQTRSSESSWFVFTGFAI